MKSHSRTARRGFTLVEILVVIVILVVIATLTMTVATRAIRSAHATRDIQNLRQVGQSLSAQASETGVFPIGQEPGGGDSWVDKIIDSQNGESTGITQDLMFISPLLVRSLPETLERTAVTHFAANPAILTLGTGGTDSRPRFTVRTSQLTRPSEQILVCGALAISSNAEYKTADPVLWGIATLLGDFPEDAQPQLDPANAEEALAFPENITEEGFFGSLPDFQRYGGNRGYFAFADGHVEAITPDRIRQKHWAVNY